MSTDRIRIRTQDGMYYVEYAPGWYGVYRLLITAVKNAEDMAVYRRYSRQDGDNTKNV